jgi:hypothetical protein
MMNDRRPRIVTGGDERMVGREIPRAAGRPAEAGDPFAQPLHVDVGDGYREQGQRLRQHDPADYGDTERLA